MTAVGTRIDPRHIQGVLEAYREFLTRVSLEPGWRRENAILDRPWGSNHAFLQWDDLAIRALLEEMRRVCPLCSPRIIERAMRDVLLALVDSQRVSEDVDPQVEPHSASIGDDLDLKALGGLLGNAIRRLKLQVKERTVFVPLEGLQLEVAEIQVATVMIRRDVGTLDRQLGPWETSEWGKAWAQMARSHWKQVKCYATVQCKGDSGYVADEALKRTNEAILVLNFFLGSTVSSRARIGVVGHQSMGHRTLLIRTDGDTEDPGIQLPSKGINIVPVIIGGEGVPRLRAGLATVNSYFESQQTAEIPARIRRAILWYGKAVSAESMDEKFLCLSTALETLLVGREGEGPYATSGSITQKLRDRTAFLLGQDFCSRYRISSRTRELYGLRSGILHRGKAVVRRQLSEMEGLVHNVIIRFLSQDFSSFEAFREWIAHHKYDRKETGEEASSGEEGSN